MKQIDEANQEALRRMLAGEPVLVDVVPAVRGHPDSLRASSCMPARRSAGSACAGRCAARCTGIAVFEGWAQDLDDAERQGRGAARFAFQPNHHFGAVGPMTGMTTMSQPVLVVENRAFGNRAYCAINEGLGKVMRFGGNDAEVLDRLRWMRDVLGPALGRGVARDAAASR